MSTNISGFGVVATLKASVTYPVGVTLTQLADDTDPIDLQALTIGEAVMGPNGDLLTWAQANAIELTLNVPPATDDDRTLQILFEANRPAKNKSVANDLITLIFAYPQGRIVTYKNGIITSGVPGYALSSDSRLKSKGYGFKFETVIVV